MIYTTSLAGYKIFSGSAVYSATQFAVRTLTEGLRMEVKPYHIGTTTVVPLLLIRNWWNISVSRAGGE